MAAYSFLDAGLLRQIYPFITHLPLLLLLVRFAGPVIRQLSGYPLRTQCLFNMRIQGALPEVIMVSDSDLCVLLSNALENDLHACRDVAALGRTAAIDVKFYERDYRLFLQVKNSCQAGIRFQKGIPVSDRENHGIGVQSIRAIVERYGGIYAFDFKDGWFLLRVSL